MKKIVLTCLMFFLFFFIRDVKADAWLLRSYLEVMGQYNFLFNATDLLSIDSEFEKTTFNYGYSALFNGVLIFGVDKRIYGFYIKKDHIDAKNKSELLLSRDKGDSIVADESWGVHYLGCGLRKYFIDGFAFNSFLPYLAVDYGFYFASNTTAKLTVKNSSETVVASATYEGNGVFPGFNLEAGFDYWLSNEFAISIKSGYRFCNGVIDAKKNGGDLKPAGISDVVPSFIDYSGIFINVGISFLFQRYD
ncbi:MAG TPA: hypothetical protein PLF61_01440 [Candidatus Goldiibacteriota bacterium]|nr:hypothetical protein [Candidatus Goldiibacteriota bacterium]